MSSPILVTKLFIPKPRQKLVNRQALLERLNTGLNSHVTLVSAPAGFGKTTLVTEWVEQLNDSQKVCWYSLDAGDNDPIRFLLYFVSSLQTVSPRLGAETCAALQSSHPPDTDDVLTVLINQLVVLPDPMMLVLDDYHLIENQTVHNAITFLIENIPPQFHLVIITREDPPLPLARLRVRRALSELRAADLRFTNEEAAQFMNQVMNLNLSQQDVSALEERTEGWIAGLQLAGLSLKGSTDQPEMLQTFTGSNRLVLDYLIEEVLNQQPEEIQNFLYQTSILSRFSGALCDAVCGLSDALNVDSGQTVLEMLERSNLFLIPLDNERHWYRYHHLFADLLRQRLRQKNAALIPELHLRASQWFEQNGHVDESVEYAFLAQDPQRAVSLIDQQADAIWGRGEHFRLWPWLVKLPKSNLYTKPRLCILSAWYLFSTGKRDQSLQSLNAAEQELNRLRELHETTNVLNENEISFSEIQVLEGRLASVQALMDSWWEDVPNMFQHAQDALEKLSPGDPWYATALMVLGDAYYYNGDIADAQKTRLATVTVCEETGDIFWYIIARLKVVTTLRHFAKLKEAFAILEELSESIKQSGLIQAISLGWLYALWGDSLNETVEIRDALPILVRSEKLTRGKDHSFFVYSEMCLIRHYFYQNQYTLAQKHLQELLNISEKYYIPTYNQCSTVYWQVRMLLVHHQPEEALEYYQQHKDIDTSEGSSLSLKIALSRIYLALNRFQEANQVLLDGIAVARKLEYAAREIELQILHALTYQGLNQSDNALSALKQAISLAEPGEYIWLFINEGPPLGKLLMEAYQQDNNSAYIQKLLSVFPALEEKSTTMPEDANTSSELIEPLSDRELDVLQLLSDGLSNQEIAHKLFLSLNTVKAHTRNIYSKLNVNSRTQAAARARGLGLVESY